MSIFDAHTMFGFWPVRRADISPETLVRVLRQHNIDQALTLSTHGIFADFVQGNVETLDICGRSNGLLLPVGTVDPRRFMGTRDEIRRRREQGVRFWRLFRELQEWTLDNRAAGSILREIKDCGGTLLLDASAPGAPSYIADRTAEVGVTTILLGVSSRQLGELLSLLDDARHLLVETRRLADPEVVKALAQRFGPNRLVFGTASPLQYVSSARLPLETAGLPDEQRALVMGGNITRLLGDAGG